MPEPKATTMQLPVKRVREIAQKAFNFQRDALQKDVEQTAAAENMMREKANKGLLRRLGLFKQVPLIDVETCYNTWKQEWLSGEMSRYHIAFDTFMRSRSWWWKRMRQFCELPETDDYLFIAMSMEDLELIDYSYFVKQEAEQAEQEKADE